MGRPREHDERTAVALLTAAERAVEAGGVEALAVRAVASVMRVEGMSGQCRVMTSLVCSTVSKGV